MSAAEDLVTAHPRQNPDARRRAKRPRRPEAAEGEEDERITKEGEMPKKAFYRARAHVNPLSHNNAFAYPAHPAVMDWASLYPGLATRSSGGGGESCPAPTIVDVGCGFGGLTVALAKLYPDEVSLGMEIRAKVCEFVRLRIEALRKQVRSVFLHVGSRNS